MKTKDALIFLRRKVVPVMIFFLGLISIIGTGDDEKDSVAPSKSLPVAVIDSPSTGMIISEGSAITFTGTATDSEELYLQGDALKWSSTVDGDIGFGSSFTRDSLSTGPHTITLTAVDRDGLADSATVDIIINPYGNSMPTASITSPSADSVYNVRDYIQFTGTGSDAEDGWLSGNALVWSSSIDGQFGIGNTISTNFLSTGKHVITLKATDNENTSGTALLSLVVKNTPPTATIDYPADGSTYSKGEAIVFNGTGYDDEDGNLTGQALEWRAGNYGTILGHGSHISIDYLPEGTNIVINFTVSDSDGLVDTDSIVITVLPE